MTLCPLCSQTMQPPPRATDEDGIAVRSFFEMFCSHCDVFKWVGCERWVRRVKKLGLLSYQDGIATLDPIDFASSPAAKLDQINTMMQNGILSISNRVTRWCREQIQVGAQVKEALSPEWWERVLKLRVFI